DAGAAVGPGKDEVGVQATATHGVVARAEGAAHDDGDLRHAGIGHGLQHFGAVFDDAVLFGVGTDHEAGGVHQIDNGGVGLATQLDELAGFVGAFGGDGAVVADK